MRLDEAEQQRLLRVVDRLGESLLEERPAAVLLIACGLIVAASRWEAEDWEALDAEVRPLVFQWMADLKGKRCRLAHCIAAACVILEATSEAIAERCQEDTPP